MWHVLGANHKRWKPGEKSVTCNEFEPEGGSWDIAGTQIKNPLLTKHQQKVSKTVNRFAWDLFFSSSSFFFFFFFWNDLKSVLSSVDSASKLELNYVQSSKGGKSISHKNGPCGASWRQSRGQPLIRPRTRGQGSRDRWPQRPIQECNRKGEPD